MSSTTTTIYGKPAGAAGVRVYEEPGITSLSDPLYGSCAAIGPCQRGPMGEFVPTYSLKQYLEIFGDPSDLHWHLYRDGKHLLPDWVEDYWSNSNQAGMVWIYRLPLSGARKAQLTLHNRMGAPVLKIEAANEGRWAGATNRIAQTPVVVATARSFTLVAPGTLANEFVGARATFTGVPGKTYTIIANEAAVASGEVIFTVGAQHNLAAEGVAGPVALAGTADYSTHAELSGTIEFPRFADLSGSININGVVLTGVGTTFTNELEVGRNIYYNGEARAITSITSDTTLTVASPFSIGGAGETLQRDNLSAIGTGTAFTSELMAGETLYVEVNGELQGRTIAAIVSDTELQLTSGFTNESTAGTIAKRDNLSVVGNGTAFLSEAAVGHYLVDPNRMGSTVKIVAIISDTQLRVEMPFSQDFNGAQLTKQSQLGAVALEMPREEGLAVEVGPGQEFPETHFMLRVYFRGRQVLEVPDASLDPDDPKYVEDEVRERNLGYQTNNREYYTWISAQSLWTSDYSTYPDSDVRPVNGAGTILAIEGNRLYTVAPLEYEFLVGEKLYPNLYRYPRLFHRIEATQSFIELSGTVSSAGVNVTGTGTTFTTTVQPGDYLYAPNTGEARRVRAIVSDTQLMVETVFSSDIPALSAVRRAGWVEVNEVYDLQRESAAGDYFWVLHPQPLERGYSGDEGRILPFYYIQAANPDLNLLERAVYGKNMGLVRIFCPGISDISVQKAFVNLAEKRAFEFRAEIPSYITSAPTAESWVLDQLGKSDFETVAFPSYGWRANPLGAGTRLVPLTGTIAGGESRRANDKRGYHHPFAGVDAVLPGIVRVPFTPDPVDEAILNRAGIHPILKVNGNYVVFGDNTPSRRPVYRNTHVRRIQSHYTRIFLEAPNFLAQLFLPNQPEVADNVIIILDQFARQEYAKGVITRYLPFDQAVEIDTEIGDRAAIAQEDARVSLVKILNGELDVKFFYAPTGVLELLNIHTGPQVLAERYGQFSRTGG